MSLQREFQAARRVFGNILRTRKHRAAVSRVRSQHERTDPGSIEIVVYFADSPVNLYQLRQWYGPLEALAEHHRVGILARSPGTALRLWEETTLPTWAVTQVKDLEDFIAHRGIKLVLYVNQNAKNFQMMRYGRMWHVFINHGESDKMYMTTNQFKTYDYAMIAGSAAVERLRAKLWDYDTESRTLQIGRPQADHMRGTPPYPADGRISVLYAPTWEGDRAAAAYGSIASHGEQIASAVLASPEHRLIYRPHPRSGVVDHAYKAAHQRIVRAIAAANQADPSARHLYDTGSSITWQLSATDVAITDVSAMIYDRLACGLPLLVTRPANPEADVDERGYLSACEWLRVEDLGGILAELDRVTTDEHARAQLAHYAEHYFGDTTPGVATERFHAAVEQLIRVWFEHAEQHRTDVFELEVDDDVEVPDTARRSAESDGSLSD
ncbi:CDP-glycerol glycerophosphotransferase family protein [Humidisolicoccus flavus]|uniref:CDP-glycerol glycerophosphotransferase family protein n=1 Tax=Humidisolicoccus flavus TaxID=3111414 RepID=UPI003248EA4D